MRQFVNGKTVALVAVAVAVAVAIYPDSVRYLPYLLFAACPLMMLWMMAGHGSHDMGHASASEATEYSCPMHPGVRSSFPAKCPRCGMNLEPGQPPKARTA
jgi:DUF2933 family protein/heavy metal-binding protein